jgi:hypothetical protein
MSLHDYEEPEWLLPFDDMRIGDSFFIPTLKPAHLIYVLNTRAKVAKVKVLCRATSSDGHLGVRVWRIR